MLDKVIEIPLEAVVSIMPRMRESQQRSQKSENGRKTAG